MGYYFKKSMKKYATWIGYQQVVLYRERKNNLNMLLVMAKWI